MIVPKKIGDRDSIIIEKSKLTNYGGIVQVISQKTEAEILEFHTQRFGSLANENVKQGLLVILKSIWALSKKVERIEKGIGI
jgi:hypothetical protein